MPPKRSSTGSDGGLSKKAKTAIANAAAAVPENRFSKVSATRNAYADYLRVHEDGKGYTFLTTCVPTSQREDEDDEDEDDEEEDDEEEDDEEEDEGEKNSKYPRCDGGKTCMCQKDPADHPNYAWVCSNAGWMKFFSCLNMLFPRDPDRFGMYTFNDHQAYGALEITQNLLVDYVEAKDNWREQWAICEGMIHWLLDACSSVMSMADDPEMIEETLTLAGRMVLSTLAHIERENLIAEVPSLRVILALWLKVPTTYREYNFFEKTSGGGAGFKAGQFDDYILAWAKKHDIALRGPDDLDEVIEARNTVKLPEPTAKKNDPYGFDAAYKKYKSAHSRGKQGIGGDALDITSWSSAERKAKAFDKKDPLKKRDLDALKDGGIMGFA